MTVPYSFGTATSAIPLSQLDSNFNTPITLGNTAIQLGNTVTTLNNMTLANVTISSGSTTLTNETVSGNLTLSGGTANGVAYLNGSKVVTTGSALTFNGTQLGVTNGAGTAIFKLDGTSAPEMDFYSSSVLKAYIYAPSTSFQINTIGTNPIIFSPNEVEGMRLNSTGLGIGTNSPAAKLDVKGTIRVNEDGAGTKILTIRSDYAGVDPAINVTTNNSLLLMTNNTIQATLSATGNLGLGVTPSTWSLGKAVEVGTLGNALWGFGSTYLSNNAYYNGGWKYASTAAASYYQQSAGVHYWFTYASGTINTGLTGGAGQAMTLDASGYLLVGYTTSNGAYKLQVNSQIFATSSTIATSDARYKEEVTPLTGALDIVNALNPVQFKWKEHQVHNFDTATPTVGFLAQEVQQVLADKPFLNAIVKSNTCTLEPAEYETVVLEPAVEEVRDEEGNVITEAKEAVTQQNLVKEAVTEEFLGIAEGNMISILTRAIQEQQAIIETLTARITALEGAKA